MKTTFYIVRHGRTQFNVLGRFQGWCDSPLTEDGVDLAKRLYKGLYDIPFELAASSTCERAIDTLENMLGDRKIPTIHHKNLREVCFGNKEGALIDFAWPGDEQDEIGYKFCGGENKDEAGIRFMNCLKEIAVDGNVLVATHSAVLYYLLHQLNPAMDVGSPNKLIPNCSVTIIELENNEFKLIKMPTVEYLG